MGCWVVRIRVNLQIRQISFLTCPWKPTYLSITNVTISKRVFICGKSWHLDLHLCTQRPIKFHSSWPFRWMAAILHEWAKTVLGKDFRIGSDVLYHGNWIFHRVQDCFCTCFSGVSHLMHHCESNRDLAVVIRKELPLDRACRVDSWTEPL